MEVHLQTSGQGFKKWPAVHDIIFLILGIEIEVAKRQLGA